MHSVREAFFKIRGIASAWISNQQDQDAAEAMGQVTATLLDTDTRDELVEVTVDSGNAEDQMAATLQRLNVANPPIRLNGLTKRRVDITTHLQDMIDQAVHKPGQWAEGIAAGGSISTTNHGMLPTDIGKLNHRRDAFLAIDAVNALPELLARLRSAESGERAADQEVERLQARLEEQVNLYNQLIDATHAERDKLTTAATDVLAERRRQIKVEGRSLEYDDRYTDGELAAAAGSYALHAHEDAASLEDAPAWWPWDSAWFKLTTPRRNLVKSGAMILAEIERLDRVEAAKQGMAEASMMLAGIDPVPVAVPNDGWMAWGPSRGHPFSKSDAFIAKVDVRLRDGSERLGDLACNHSWFWYDHTQSPTDIVEWRPHSVPADDGWIPWESQKDGTCPVDAGTLVDVRYRDGGEAFAVAALESFEAAGIHWDLDHLRVDIVAYRLSAQP